MKSGSRDMKESQKKPRWLIIDTDAGKQTDTHAQLNHLLALDLDDNVELCIFELRTVPLLVHLVKFVSSQKILKDGLHVVTYLSLVLCHA